MARGARKAEAELAAAGMVVVERVGARVDYRAVTEVEAMGAGMEVAVEEAMAAAAWVVAMAAAGMAAATVAKMVVARVAAKQAVATTAQVEVEAMARAAEEATPRPWTSASDAWRRACREWSVAGRI